MLTHTGNEQPEGYSHLYETITHETQAALGLDDRSYATIDDVGHEISFDSGSVHAGTLRTTNGDREDVYLHPPNQEEDSALYIALSSVRNDTARDKTRSTERRVRVGTSVNFDSKGQLTVDVERSRRGSSPERPDVDSVTKAEKHTVYTGAKAERLARFITRRLEQPLQDHIRTIDAHTS